MKKTPPLQNIWTPLQYAIFRMLWVTSLISNIGTWMHEVSAAWLMTTLTHKPLLVALVQATTASAICLFALPAGALADIVDKRRYLIILQFWMMIIASLLAIFTFMGKMTPYSLLTLNFCLGLGTAFNAPAWQTAIPEMVPKKELISAITLNSMGVNFSRTIGPALAGFLIASLGPAYVFAFNAVSFLGVIIVLFHWKREVTISALPGERLLGAIKAGIRYAKSTPSLKIIFLKSFSLFFFVSSIWALLPLVAKNVLHKNSITYGILLGTLGLGAVMGAFLAPWVRATLNVDKLLLAGAAAFSFAMLNLIIYPNVYLACISSFVTGIAWILVLSSLNATVQQSVPSWIRARAMSMYLMAFFGSLALGGIFWGWLASHYSISISILTSGIGTLIVGLIVYRIPLDETIVYDHTPSMDLPAPLVERQLNHEEGPVLITVEYTVATDKIEAFAKAIQELRLTRLREGAFSWTLFKDVEKPNRFVECFIAESWLEHLRFHERVSISDRKIQSHVNSFCESARPTTTHYVAYSFKKTQRYWKR